MFKKDGTVLQFNNPKVQASLGSNTFAISGHAESKDINELVPSLFRDFKPENLGAIKNLISSGKAFASSAAASGSAAVPTEEVPEVESFDDATKAEA
jgi:nascent polypeptide-associated complex subunit beta